MSASAETLVEGMPRDTLVFRAGVLARTVLSLAFGAPHMHAVYAAWLCSAGRGAPGGGGVAECQALMEAGLEMGGRLCLLARHQPTQFVITCEHERFKATACVAYEPSRERVDGLHVVDFQGDPHGGAKDIQIGKLVEGA